MSVDPTTFTSPTQTALAIQLEEISTKSNTERMSSLTSISTNINHELRESLTYHNSQMDSDVARKFMAVQTLQSILSDMASRVVYREEVEDTSLATFHREQLWKRAFARLRFHGQWSLYNKRMLRASTIQMRKYHLVRLFNGWRNEAYRSKREKFKVAYVKRCELEKDQLLVIQESIVQRLKEELVRKNQVLGNEEKRLDELNRKYSLLKQSHQTPVTVLKRGETSF